MIPQEAAVSEYYDLRHQLEELSNDFRAVITHPSYILPFLQPGRLVRIKHEQNDFGWGIVVDFNKRVAPKVFTLF